MKELPVRKSIRLKGYDYSSAGYYFITMCVEGGHELLWEEERNVGARNARPLSHIGETVKIAIENIPKFYANTVIDKYVIMPNHIHMIITLNEDERGRIEGVGRAMRAPTISRIINQMKGYVTKQIGFSIWQKLFHDEIIRNEEAYRNIWQYIENNPAKWAEDEYFVKETGGKN